MTDQSRSKVIKEHPIGNGLDAFRASFSSICEDRNVSRDPGAVEHLGQEDLQNLVLVLLSTLQIHPATRLLRSSGNGKNLFDDLLRLNSAVNSGEFDSDRIKPLVRSAVADIPDDTVIWNHVYDAVTESTPPPRPIASLTQQTPRSQNTSGLVNSSEFRRNVDPILKLELERLYVGLPKFYKAFFGDVPDLEAVSATVFRKCAEGDNPLFGGEGWSGWPMGAKETDVLTWLGGLIPKLDAFAGDRISTPATRRKLLCRERLADLVSGPWKRVKPW